jgi:hypothetical protein
MSADLCPSCGHPWAEHSKTNGCEHEPFCWCHLPDPAAVNAELDEHRPVQDEGEGRNG